MKKLIYMMAFLAIASQLTDCKKKEDDDDDSSSTPANVLCDGKGANIWVPLDSANTWTYKFTIAGIAQTSPVLVARETSEHDGKSYRYIADDDGFMFLSDYELREEASTHDMYRYYDGWSQEFLEVPGAPTLNQTWDIFSSHTRKVTNLSASVSTSGCNYTGVLEITEYDGSSDVVNTFYYKKGLGLIKVVEPGQFGNTYVLSAVTLK
jgi:hypothetical protein